MNSPISPIDQLTAKRHTLAHLLAAAVLEFYPDAKPTIGPAIDNGFYYDFSFKRPFTPDDLNLIEKKMLEIAKRDLEIRGAGNILGKAQSGVAYKVGLNLYFELLEEAVAELKRKSAAH